jgi:hypothetical protein
VLTPQLNAGALVLGQQLIVWPGTLRQQHTQHSTAKHKRNVSLLLHTRFRLPRLHPSSFVLPQPVCVSRQGWQQDLHIDSCAACRKASTA